MSGAIFSTAMSATRWIMVADRTIRCVRPCMIDTPARMGMIYKYGTAPSSPSLENQMNVTGRRKKMYRRGAIILENIFLIRTR